MLLYFLDAYAGKTEISYTEEHLIVIARLLIRPMLEKGHERKALAVDSKILELMITRLFDNPEQTSEKSCQSIVSYVKGLKPGQ